MVRTLDPVTKPRWQNIYNNIVQGKKVCELIVRSYLITIATKNFVPFL